MQNLTKDFPSLQNKIIYFDNACQSLRPKQVINAIKEYYEEYPACAGRSAHKLARKVEQKIWQVREKIAEFINARKPEEIIFTRNTTESINLVARCLKPKKVSGSDKEHNSNRLPWGNAWSTNIENPDLFASVHISNLDGTTQNITKTKALFLLDAAQSIPHQKIDVQKLDVDFLVFSGHKMLGPSGIGVLYGKKEFLEKMPVFLQGGGMVSGILPEKFEAGLQNYAGIIGLGAAVDYLSKIKNIQEHEYKLNKFITENLKNLPVKILGPEDPKQRSSIISFYSDKISSHEIALKLDQANIAVRAGRFCCDYWFEKNKIKDAVRVSLYFYNTLEEAKIFVRELEKICN